MVYCEKDKNFYIELPENADPWRIPLLLSSFAKRGEQTINAYWSKLWVQQRIVPSDRQNIGKILKENGLNEYEEYELLMLGQGRCAQDDYYLEALPENELPKEVAKRFQNKVEDVVPLKDRQLLVFFRDFVSHRVVNAAEAAEMLECSRQNIGDLVQREKLHPIKREAKSALFLKNEVVQRKWM